MDLFLAGVFAPQEKDRSLYTQNGLLHMLDRNRRIKPGPQRLQECSDKFDVVISCEERVYDQILESECPTPPLGQRGGGKVQC